MAQTHNIVTDQDLGDSLEVKNDKLEAKVSSEDGNTVEILSDGLYSASELPEATENDEGKVLTVDHSGGAVWEDSSGGGGVDWVAHSGSTDYPNELPGAYGDNSIVIGYGANMNTAGGNSIVIGEGADNTGNGTFSNVIIGAKIEVEKPNFQTGVLVGSGILAKEGDVAIGRRAVIDALSAIAIGDRAKSQHLSSIALGSSAVTDRESQVSVGDPNSGLAYARERFISNVKDPVEPQDAATKNYVDGSVGFIKHSVGSEYSSTPPSPYEASNANSLAIGWGAKTTQIRSIAIGDGAEAHGNSVAIGAAYLFSGAKTVATGSGSVAIGFDSRAVGSHGTSLGYYSQSIGDSSLALGWNSKANSEGSSAIGYGAESGGEYQLQLGNSGTTVYAYGAVQDRSDARDKTDIAPANLGLNFINRLNPVSYKLDYRDAYREKVRQEYDRGQPVDEPFLKRTLECPEDCTLDDIIPDGSLKRVRTHYGLIAQEVKQVMDDLGVDFGGYQDHKVTANGDDALTLGYSQFIAPLIKAVQELSAEVEDLRSIIKGT